MVYSMHPRITKALAQFHVKDSGTPANTQMNLRLILENFRNADLDNLETSIDAKITQFEEEGVRILTGRMPGKESGKFQLKRLLKFKKIQTLLKFIKSLKNGERQRLNKFPNT